jgi:hypothetical protein
MPLKNLLRCVKIGAFKAVLYSGRQSNFDPNFYIFLPIEMHFGIQVLKEIY